jgi:hypothetical protein
MATTHCHFDWNGFFRTAFSIRLRDHPFADGIRDTEEKIESVQAIANVNNFRYFWVSWRESGIVQRIQKGAELRRGP